MPSNLTYGGPRATIPKLQGQFLFKTAAVRKGEEDLCFPNVYGSDGEVTPAYCQDPSFAKRPTKPASANGRPRTSPAVSSSQVFGNPDAFPSRPTDMMSSSVRKTESPRKKLGMRKKPPHALPQLEKDGSSSNNNRRPQSAPTKKKGQGTKTVEEIDQILNTASQSKSQSHASDDHFEYNVWKVLAVVDFRRTVPPRPLFKGQHSN